jgi:ankyrin repeat protein
MAKILLAINTDVNVRDKSGFTPLHWAAVAGAKDIAELLLANNADVHAKNNNGDTPLHWAARNGRQEVAELLLANKADVNAKDNGGVTPVRFAEEVSMSSELAVWELSLVNKPVVELLRQHGGHE